MFRALGILCGLVKGLILPVGCTIHLCMFSRDIMQTMSISRVSVGGLCGASCPVFQDDFVHGDMVSKALIRL